MIISIGLAVFFVVAAISFFYIRNLRTERYEQQILDAEMGMNKRKFKEISVDGLSQKELALIYDIFTKRFDTNDFLLDPNFNLEHDLMFSREDIKDVVTDYFLKMHASHIPGTTEIQEYENGNGKIKTVREVLECIVFLKES